MALSGDLVWGTAAGTAGNAALFAFERWETQQLGRAPVYAARQIARRWFGGGAADQRRWGRRLRTLYTAALGVTLAHLRRRTKLPAPINGLLLGVVVAGIERYALPLLRATPPPRNWSRKERALLWPHAALFGAVTDWTLSTR